MATPLDYGWDRSMEAGHVNPDPSAASAPCDSGNLRLSSQLEQRIVRFMESHEVIKEALSRVSPKAVAADLGVSLSLVYKWAQPNNELGSGSRNPLDRIKKLMELTGDPRIVQWLCQQAGGHFVKNPSTSGHRDYDITPATAEIVNQFAALLQVITKAAADRSITVSEAKAIREVWDSLKTYTEGFVKCCEERNFERVPPAPRPGDPWRMASGQ